MFAVFMLAATFAAAPETDVLSEMRAGKMLCSNPDPVTKTCSTIDSYAPAADGLFIDTGEVLLSGDPAITLETSSAVQIEGAVICGTVELLDLEKGKVRMDGTLLPPDRNSAAIAKLIEKLRPLAGRRVCEGLRVEDGLLMKYGQMEKVDVKLPGKPVSWIAPADGYRVAPR